MPRRPGRRNLRDTVIGRDHQPRQLDLLLLDEAEELSDDEHDTLKV